MGNDTLRAALQSAGLSPDDLANIVGVDVRTVRRWLSGGTPYPRQQGKVARALDTAEGDLWPQTATTQARPPAAGASDMVAAYAAASDAGLPDWQALMRDATDRIDLLADTLAETVGTPGVPDLLATKAARGCAVRVLIHDTDQHLAPLRDQPGVEIRLLDLPAAYLIHRYDDQLLLTLHMIGQNPEDAPLLHLRRTGPQGLFNRLADYYNDLWTQDCEPLTPTIQADGSSQEDDERHNPDTEARFAGPDRTQARSNEPSPTPPRRWPGRN